MIDFNDDIVSSLKEKGTSFGFNSDNIILMPIDIGRKFIANRMNYEINVISKNADSLDYIIGQVTADFRKIRKLKPSDNNNFKIVKSDNLASRLIQNIQFITFSTTLIGLMTLMEVYLHIIVLHTHTQDLMMILQVLIG